VGAPAGTPATISLPQLRAFGRDAFERAGLNGPDADTGAEVLSTTDAWGVFTHGTKALRGYLRRLRAGGLRPRGRPGRGARDPASVRRARQPPGVGRDRRPGPGRLPRR